MAAPTVIEREFGFCGPCICILKPGQTQWLMLITTDARLFRMTSNYRILNHMDHHVDDDPLIYERNESKLIPKLHSTWEEWTRPNLRTRMNRMLFLRSFVSFENKPLKWREAGLEWQWFCFSFMGTNNKLSSCTLTEGHTNLLSWVRILISWWQYDVLILEEGRHGGAHWS